MAVPIDSSDRSSLPRVAGAMAVVLGIVGVLGYLAGFAFGPNVPEVVRYANGLAAIAEVGLGLGIWQRRRAAWAFGLSLEAALILVNLMALPQLLRLGAAGMPSVILAGGRMALAGLLAAGSDEFKTG